MTPTTDRYANVNGIQLHYAECGKGELVIFLHGFPEFWYSWHRQLEVVGRYFHAVAPDMRGYNLSDKPPQVEDYKIVTLVEDVVGLIDHFGSPKAALVAHDWGAGVAWAVAQKYPNRVSKLVVLQVPPAAAWRENMSLKQLMRSWYMFFFLIPRLPEWLIRRRDFRTIDRMFDKSVFRKNSFSAEDIERYKHALAKPGAVTAALNYYRANVMDRLKPLKTNGAGNISGKKISVPTLFIFGEQDFAILPATVRGIEKHIDAPYFEHRIKDSGHWVQNEAPDEVNRALLKFLLSR